jgi:predicted DNA-binding protein
MGVRLPPDARDRLDYEAERTSRFPAHILAELIRIHIDPAPEWWKADAPPERAAST